jgi:hypothetical protein
MPWKLGAISIISVLLIFLYSAHKISERSGGARVGETERPVGSFVTDVDMYIDHWQTKDVGSFSVRFPKEWYWVEVPPEKPGYYGYRVISNNPGFPLDKYQDIGIFTGDDYPLVFSDDTELVVTDRGWPTENSGSPRKSLDSEMRRIKEDVNPLAACEYLSDPRSVPAAAYCSFVNSVGQRIQTYYLAYNMTTFAFTSRTTENNAARMKDILEMIARSFTVKNKSFN